MLGRLRGGVLDVHEVHRFANDAGPPERLAALGRPPPLAGDAARARSRSHVPIESVGVDTWGVDYALLGEHGNLLENPYHYRDPRTDGVMEAVFERVGRERIYAITGIQFLPINTLYQLYAACRPTPRLVDAARALVTIPDLFNYWLTGSLSSEYTIATTTQFVDARTRTWATRLLDELGLPTRLLQPLVEPGTIVGRLVDNASPRLRGTPVIAPACHDTASAVASVAHGRAHGVSQLRHLVAARHRAAGADHHLQRARAELHERRRRRAARPAC